MPLNLSNHKAIDTYYAALATYRTQDVTHEQATHLAFSTLLDAVSKTAGWTLVLEQTLANRKRPDGTLYDDVKFPRGYWEAKDTHDDLDAEIKAVSGGAKNTPPYCAACWSQWARVRR